MIHSLIPEEISYGIGRSRQHSRDLPYPGVSGRWRLDGRPMVSRRAVRPSCGLDADARASLDYLVCAGEQRRRQRQPDCLCSFDVGYKLKFGWLEDRNIARLGSGEDSNDLPCDLTECLWQIYRIGQKSADVDKLTVRVDCWQRMQRRQFDNRIAI